MRLLLLIIILLSVSATFQSDKPDWLVQRKVGIKLDTSLCHYGKAFKVGSVIGIDYIGFVGEHAYYPVNEQGKVINTITKTRKLNLTQINKLHKMLSNPAFYTNSRMVACYEPRLAFIYFKNGKVIAQTQICLSCA